MSSPAPGATSGFRDENDGLSPCPDERYGGAPDLRFVDPRRIAEVDSALDHIGMQLSHTADSAGGPPLDILQDAARRIHMNSGCFGLAPLGVAALMLADYLAVLSARGDRDDAGVHIYVDALRTLRRTASPAGSRDILEGLELLARRRRRATSQGPARAA